MVSMNFRKAINKIEMNVTDNITIWSDMEKIQLQKEEWLCCFQIVIYFEPVFLLETKFISQI